MTEFQELVKNAPNFTSMEHGELVIYAYAMYAAGIKTDAENTKLREYITKLEQANIVLDSDNCELKNDIGDMQFFIDDKSQAARPMFANENLHEWCCRA